MAAVLCNGLSAFATSAVGLCNERCRSCNERCGLLRNERWRFCNERCRSFFNDQAVGLSAPSVLQWRCRSFKRLASFNWPLSVLQWRRPSCNDNWRSFNDGSGLLKAIPIGLHHKPERARHQAKLDGRHPAHVSICFNQHRVVGRKRFNTYAFTLRDSHLGFATCPPFVDAREFAHHIPPD